MGNVFTLQLSKNFSLSVIVEDPSTRLFTFAKINPFEANPHDMVPKASTTAKPRHQKDFHILRIISHD